MKWFGKGRNKGAKGGEAQGQDVTGKCGHCGKEHKTSKCPNK